MGGGGHMHHMGGGRVSLKYKGRPGCSSQSASQGGCTWEEEGGHMHHMGGGGGRVGVEGQVEGGIRWTPSCGAMPACLSCAHPSPPPSVALSSGCPPTHSDPPHLCYQVRNEVDVVQPRAVHGHRKGVHLLHPAPHL